mmetsp:Transcript_54036/g.124404  ORF Transcript_54036/g.124404 Transcript_54036/m.124404 type:complete len:332 (-) Transcript_54036:122-1117(-)|eukprot:CAMPEP_0119380408 /NCGR_PEP_ID=MMETSP1334-20130426/56836_1 /TAXON_ID=127549 /ORGANISM="Calcidiscus leptoporus, Strain RCC1130" /LENGTH=331 /DNA_ID=CAMNT_0007400221 /DNA_START=186 /DNA_END=1181 /DNA_ORIENTATION=-
MPKPDLERTLRVLLLAAALPYEVRSYELRFSESVSSVHVGEARARMRCARAEAAPGALLVVGYGVLGEMVAKQWLAGGRADEAHVVYGMTRRADPERNERLRAAGIRPCVRADFERGDLPACAHVVFCAPPGGNDDYSAEVGAALSFWSEGANAASFVFTSSAGVFAEQDGGVVTETSPVGTGARIERLLMAEERVREAGGTVLRLAGLYTYERGAHSAFFRKETLESSASGLINQVHYEDAAAATVAALIRPAPGSVLLAADDKPMSRIDICRAAGSAPRFNGRPIPTFTATADGAKAAKGKVIDCSYTRELIGWHPRYRSFAEFMAQQL